MKANNVVLFIILLGVGVAQGVSVDSLKDAYKKKMRILRDTLLSLDGNRQSAQSIVKAQKALRDLEDENDITSLSRQIGQLRVEVCHIQNEDPTAQKIVRVLKKTAQTAKQLTTAERNQIDQIAQKTAANPGEKKHYEAELRRLDKAIKQKTKTQSEKIISLNHALYNLPSIRNKFDEVAPLAAELRKKYSAIKIKTQPHDEKIAAATKEINGRMGKQANKIMKLRSDIRKLRKLIEKKDPCFAAEESLRHQRWERFFA
jgi:chromosome segregation ATPase